MRAKCPTQAVPSKPRILVYGEPGVGKTTWALKFPDALLIDCEGGANLPNYTKVLKEAGALYMGLEDGAGDFESVVAEVKECAMVEHDRKTLIIDGFTKLFANEVRDQLDRMEKNKESPGFGREKITANQWTRKLLKWIDQCDMNIVLICHSAADYSDDKQGIKADCPKDCLFDLNLVLECFSRGTQRRAKVTKSRYEQFQEAEVFDLTYEAFAEKWQSKGVAA